jgi:chitodextrinase
VAGSGARTVDLVWGAASDNIAVDHYSVFVDGVVAASTSGIRLDGIAVSDGVVHVFSVAAVDAAGNVGPTAGMELALPDVTAPSTAVGFSAAPTGATSVALAWSAATDNVGVVAYRLKRNGIRLSDLGPSAVGLTDAGLTSGATYTYTLAAVDAAGNVGQAASVEVRVGSADVTPPTAPLDLRAVALSKRRISLTWAASTDDRPGSLRYKVFRGRKRVATVTTLSYVDRPAVSGWYKYRVKAVDSAGNVSSFSVAVRIKAHR